MNKLFSALLICGALIGCGGSNSTAPSPRPSPTPSPSAYLDFMKARYSEIAGSNYDFRETPRELNYAEAVSDSSSNDASANFSSTNVQVAGVDETDLIEFDGDVLLTLNRSLNAYHYSPEVFNDTPTVRVFDEATLEGEQNEDPQLHLALSDDYSYDGLLSYGEHSALIGHRGGWWGILEDAVFCDECNHIQESSVLIKLWQHKDANGAIAPEINEVVIDGDLIETRSIENKLYIVSSYSPQIDIRYYPQTQTEIDANQSIINRLTIADITPSISINGNTELMLENASCRLPTEEVAFGHVPNVVLITEINMLDASQWKTSCAINQGGTVFVSQNNIYLASSRWWGEQVVDISKFSITEDGVEYRASGSVAGFLSGDSYHFGEVDGDLVVVNSFYDNGSASQTWWNWGNERHQLSVLRENGEALEILSQIPNESQTAAIGKPGEDIYSVRILGNRAYIVTFEKIDPLYVIDLSDTSTPTILGELEIPGFSAYLHPISEDLVLGVGKNVVPDEGFSWFQGLNVRLFDVSNPQNPSLVESLDYGLRGSESEVLYDPHALSYLLDDSSGIARITIPMSLNGDASAPDPELTPSAYYPFTEAGLYQFEVNTNTPALREVGRVTRSERNSDWYVSSGDRAVINNNSVYYAHGDSLDIFNWGSSVITRSFEIQSE